MPLTRDQRVRLARVFRWARNNGWRSTAWGHAWRSDRHWVTFDPTVDVLRVDSFHPGVMPVATHLRRAKVFLNSADEALDVLTALGVLDPSLSPIVDRYTEGAALDDDEPVDGADAFDGPASFEDAGQAFADQVDGRVSPRRAAEVLSALARQGLIVSTEYADELSEDLALDRRLSGDGADLGMVLLCGEYVVLDEEPRS